MKYDSTMTGTGVTKTAQAFSGAQLMPPPAAIPLEMTASTMERIRYGSLVGALAVSALGGLVLIGWSIDSEPLKRVISGKAAMNPMTAVGFLLLGGSLMLRLGGEARAVRGTACGAAFVAVVVGLVRLAEGALGAPIGLDHLLFAREVSNLAFGPTGMGYLTATGLVHSGLALLLLDVRTRGGWWPAQPLNVVSGYLGLLVLADVAYHAEGLQELSSSGAMGMHTAACFMLLTLATLCARPDRGILPILATPWPGVSRVRRLLLMALALPPVLGFAKVTGVRLGWFRDSVGDVLMVISMMAVQGEAVRRTARSLRSAFVRIIDAEERLRSSTTAAGIGTWNWHFPSQVMHWSTTCKELFGLAADASITYERFLQCLHPDDREATGRAVQEALTEHTEYETEYRVVWPDGEIRWIAAKGKGIYDDAGQLYRMEGIVRDITKRRRDEETLRDQDARIRAIVENAADAIITIDERGRIESANPATERMFGYPADQLVGRNVACLMPESYAREHDGYLARYLKTGEKRILDTSREVAGRRSDGTVFPLKLSVRETLLGNSKLFVGLITDITQLKQAEAVLERARDELEVRVQERTTELARSNQELEQFAYVASHDLQEPLRMVASYMQLLERRYSEKLDSDAKEFIEFAVGGTVRMKRLIHDLLTYSRVGTAAKAWEPTDCEAVLKQALANLEIAIRESGSGITHDPLPTIEADPTQLGQLFQNLIGNAVKYRGDRVPAIHVSARRERDRWVFSVRDNGIGFDPKFSERIFVIFQRLHAKNEYSGTGIGLAVCKKIVERHGGRIWVESQPGSGSTFFFTLPTGQEAAHAESRGDRQTHRDLVGGGQPR